MKTKYFILAAIAAVGLVGCTNDDFVGDLSPNVVEETNVADNGIRFGGGFRAVTRADNKVGADAAALLNNKFYVTGVKGDGTPANMDYVFKTYSVLWEANTAGKTESNTSDWEYVGKTHDWGSTTKVTEQTIKYWDFSVPYYDFAAYSLGSGVATGTVIDYENATTAAYTLTGDVDDLKTCYITDMKTVAKADYGNEVTLNFRSLVTKVRMAIYETVPGYSVKNVYFYEDNTTGINTNISSNTDAILFGGDATTGAFFTQGTYTVSFPNIGIDKAPGGTNETSDYNKAHVAINSSATGTSTETTKAFGPLNYDANGFLGKTSTEATFAGDDAPWYQIVLPNEDGAVLEMRVNYTLVSDDGTDNPEEITIHGAKAYVPLQFTQWKPNYAYTYIFKISDNTNGWTSISTDDPAGLFPITFDAIVLDPIDETTEQTTITTVATPSITTYQKGHLYTHGPEYNAGDEDIFVQVMIDGALQGDLATNGKIYTLSGITNPTEADVLSALSIQTSAANADPIVGRNGLSLDEGTLVANFTTIPAMDGNNIILDNAGEAASFDAVAGKYAFVYDTQKYSPLYLSASPSGFPTGYYTNAACTTAATGTWDSSTTYYAKESYIYSAVTFTETDTQAPEDWSGNYWDNPDGTGNAVSSYAAPDAGKTKTYYRRYKVSHKIYGVKVITVK